MSKLIESKLLDKIFNFFDKSDSSEKNKFLDKVKEKDPQLAKSFEKWNDDFVKLLVATKKVKEKYNQDTSNVDRLLSKYK